MVKLLRHIPTKFSAKFPSSFQSLPLDWELHIEILKVEANVWNLQQTSQITCKKFSEMHCKYDYDFCVHSKLKDGSMRRVPEPIKL